MEVGDVFETVEAFQKKAIADAGTKGIEVERGSKEVARGVGGNGGVRGGWGFREGLGRGLWGCGV
jgi:hypothetical protein